MPNASSSNLASSAAFGGAVGRSHQLAFEVVLIEHAEEDGREIRRLLHGSPDADFDVRWCTDLASARDVLIEDRSDCVLVDLALPDSHGLRTLSHVLSLTSSPVVVLSDQRATNTRQHALANSAIGFLGKDELTSTGLTSAILAAIDQQDRLIELRASAHRHASMSRSTALRDAGIDPLTGALNHQALLAAVDHELHTPWHALELLGVVHCSLTSDDAVPIEPATLQAAQRRITSVMRPEDCVARVRGSEFVVVAPHLSDRDALEAISQRIRRAFDEPVAMAHGPRSLTASVGHGAVTIGHACVVGPPLPQLLLTSAELAQRDTRPRSG